jgi:hypothetical protein
MAARNPKPLPGAAREATPLEESRIKARENSLRLRRTLDLLPLYSVLGGVTVIGPPTWAKCPASAGVASKASYRVLYSCGHERMLSYSGLKSRADDKERAAEVQGKCAACARADALAEKARLRKEEKAQRAASFPPAERPPEYLSQREVRQQQEYKALAEAQRIMARASKNAMERGN